MIVIQWTKYMRIWIIALIFIQLVAAGCTSQSKNEEILLDGKGLSQVWVYDTGAPIKLAPVHAG